MFIIKLRTLSPPSGHLVLMSIRASDCNGMPPRETWSPLVTGAVATREGHVDLVSVGEPVSLGGALTSRRLKAMGPEVLRLGSSLKV